MSMLGSCTQCRLGKWYANEWKDKYQNTKSYAKIYKPHESVHENMNQSIRHLAQNEIYDTNLIISNLKTTEHSTLELFSVLDEMLVEYGY